MGLITTALQTAASVMSDTWRDYFYCDALSSDILVAKGQKKNKKRSNDNIISNGSIIAVNDGQCMIIVDQGKVAEFCAQPGEFLYDSSTEPSLFYGSLGENILETFKQFGRRFGFGGATGKDQRVYYFNTKEIIGNKYGTPSPVPFRVVDKNINLDVDIAIRCFGEYSYKMSDPILFYTNVCGNVADTYNRSQIDEQLKSELLTALQPAFAKISAMGIRYSALPGHTMELADALNEDLSKKWAETRGITVAAFGVSSVKASEEDEKMIKEMQKAGALQNANMAAATLVGAQASAMQEAAKNPNGAMMGFAGFNMAQQAGGMNAQALFQMGQQQATAAGQAAAQAGWDCECGQKGNTGKFCSACGKAKPADPGFWTCACGAKNKGKFCSECGAPKPADAPLYKCDKCGWEPEDPMNPPKFCPNCGDPFDEADKL
ncbi:MAG: SPFH domain-containing protein [Lachnospiraceae bacterium]|nr:SPFH domain-containing protein [Lachnospiraceae bacterium]